MNDTEYGLTAGVYTQGRAAREEDPRAGRRRQRLLELLRPREPAAAVVGRRALGHRPHAVDLRHPDLHAPKAWHLKAPERLAHRVAASTVRAPSCSSAARSVLASSVAIVIGPTPPGTGVIHAARSFAAAKSTSPHELAVGVAVDADVDHDRARLDPVALHEIRPCRRRRRRCRACRTMPGRSRVFEWQIVTVQRCHQQLQRHRPADDVRLPDDDRVLADEILARVLEQRHAAVRRARPQRRPLQHQPADVVRMEAVDVLLRIDALGDAFARRSASAAAAARGCRCTAGSRLSASMQREQLGFASSSPAGRARTSACRRPRSSCRLLRT